MRFGNNANAQKDWECISVNSSPRSHAPQEALCAARKSVQHRFDRVAFTALDDDADIEGIMRRHDQCAANGSIAFDATTVEFPAAVAELGAEGAADTVPGIGLGIPSPCPFVADPEANSYNWQVLHDKRDDGSKLVAMNIITIPDPELYAEYAFHFRDLPQKYGFRVRQCGKVPLEGSRKGACTMLVAVEFPNARAFASAWSDPVIKQEAFPLREAMFARGFRHIWIRCGYA